jgi:hypothetical protein
MQRNREGGAAAHTRSRLEGAALAHLLGRSAAKNAKGPIKSGLKQYRHGDSNPGAHPEFIPSSFRSFLFAPADISVVLHQLEVVAQVCDP